MLTGSHTGTYQEPTASCAHPLPAYRGCVDQEVEDHDGVLITCPCLQAAHSDHRQHRRHQQATHAPAARLPGAVDHVGTSDERVQRQVQRCCHRHARLRPERPTHGRTLKCKPRSLRTCWQQPDRYSATRHPPPGCHRRSKHSRWSALPWLRPQARRDYYIDVLVADVVAVVLTLGYKTCVLAGHDWCATRRLPNDHPSPESACGWSSTAARACAVWCCACRVAALLPAAHGWPSMGSTCNRSRLSRAHAYMRSHCAGPGLIRSS